MEDKMEGIRALVGVTDESIAYPEWLAETVDMEWDELTDEQRTWFENYRAYIDEQHKNLSVTPKNPGKTKAQQMALQLAEDAKKTEAEPIFMRYDPHGQFGAGVYCECGARKIHNRGKVLARWADKHFEKTGHYWKRT